MLRKPELSNFKANDSRLYIKINTKYKKKRKLTPACIHVHTELISSVLSEGGQR